MSESVQEIRAQQHQRILEQGRRQWEAGNGQPLRSQSCHDRAGAQALVPDYDSLTVAQVMAHLPLLEHPEVQSLLDYEAGHRQRKTLLTKLASRLKALKHNDGAV